MKCIIPGNHVKVFGRAIHSLSKIGDELYVEPLDTGIALRTVNSSRSAYACFLFNSPFFHEYTDGRQTDAPDDDPPKCKIAMKSCLSVFRSLSSIEKTVERCKLTLNIEDARLVFQLYCRHGIVKTHNLAFIECETLQAVFSADTTSNHLTSQSRLLCDVVANFQNNHEEITLTVTEDKVAFKNYCDDVADPNKVMHTELSLDSEEFDVYQMASNTDVTFCLKELRAILLFSEATNLPLSLHFDTPGKPIIFSMDGDTLFESSFVLATLADPGAGGGDCTQTQNQTKNTTRNNNTTKNRSTTKRASQNHHDNTSSVDIRSDTTILNNRHTIAPAHTNHRYDEVPSSNPYSQPIPNQHNPLAPQRVQNQPISSQKQQPDVQQRPGTSSNSESPVIPNILNNINMHDTSHVDDICVNEDEDDEELNETIPGTPPNKKFKSLFFGVSQSQPRRSQHSQPQSEVLAADTDDEDD